MCLQVVVEFEQVIKPKYVCDLLLNEIGAVEEEEDDLIDILMHIRLETDFYMRIGPGMVLYLNELRLASTTELGKECVLLPKGALTLCIQNV